ncbi:MAG: outer membrane beta-barrel protein [Bdellovibrionota bacterium]
MRGIRNQQWAMLAFFAVFIAASNLSSASDRTQQPEEDDFSGTPFTEYGEFNQEEEEAAETNFLQHGRFFGVSLGLGLETASGNRGSLWQGGFPLFDLRLHYWFDFNFALNLGLYTARHFYETPSNNEHVDVSFIHLGIDLKYYFDTKNLSAPISAANPFLLLGGGAFSKGETSAAQSNAETDSSLGLSAGAGLEFAITPRKLYFDLEWRMHLVSFNDTYTTTFKPIIDDMTGQFYTMSGSFLFTW